jgi:hypothetical protein
LSKPTFSTVAFLLALASPVCAQTQPTQAEKGEVPSHGREYLRDLAGVSVEILVLTGDDLTNTVLSNKVRTDVELRLRQFGVPIQKAGDATLSVSANVGPREGTAYSYVVELTVYQRLRSLATGRIWSLKTYDRGDEWRKADAHRCEEQRPPCEELLRNTVRDKVDTFINDWLEVHRKLP